MAEGAFLLAKKYQKIIMPDLNAGCPMADMIDLEIAKKLYRKLNKSCKREIIPVVYMNSYADMKSFCGEKDGCVCTSSNAGKIIEYYLAQDKENFL
jgi:quinolinate synthase